MKRTRNNKGITLVALIITIIVLLILVVVSIRAVQGDGIIEYAKNAKSEYELAQANENEMLESYIGFLESEKSATTFEEATKSIMLEKKVNSTVYDEYGNKIVVPAGFKIRVDATTNNADTVTEGIVVEDASGNQFVWIPVGTIYTNTDKTESKLITLGRYSTFTATEGVYTPVQTAENYATSTIINTYYTEDTISNHNSSYENVIAKNLEEFITSATMQSGYYLGRYEAGDSSSDTVASRTGSHGISTEGTLVCKENQVPFNWIMQVDSANLCRNMYSDGYSSGTFSSDLINSYAWDTAIIFIQTFGTKSNSSNYANTSGLSAINTSEPGLTGKNILSETSAIDEQLNIYDMAGNCREQSTETVLKSDYPVGVRGSNYRNGSNYSSNRTVNADYNTGNGIAFRPIIYVAR